MKINSRSDQSWAWDNLDYAHARELLGGQLPGADHTSLEPLGSSDFCLAFRLGNQVVRIARHIVALLPLPVPRLTYYSPSGCPPFTLHDEITGEVLTRENWENLPAPARKKAVSNLATFLRVLPGSNKGTNEMQMSIGFPVA